jgi:phospholipid-binding lipoprotein MlaA
VNILAAHSCPAVHHPAFGRHSSGDGRREFTCAAVMSGKIERRLHRRAARPNECTARRWALAVCATLAVSVSSSLASAAAENFDAHPEPSLASRLGEIAGSVYDTAESRLIAPSRQAAEEILAHPRTQEIYQDLSETARGLVALADSHVLQPISRESAELIGRPEMRQSYEAVHAIAGDVAEKLRLGVLDPLIAKLKHAAERAMAVPSVPGAAAPRLAVAADPFVPALAIPGLSEGDILRNLNDDDPLEPFNRAMFRLNVGLQANLFGPVSQLYFEHTSAGVQLGVGNFFRNLREPATFVSSALEGQLDDAGTAAARFGINTTLGIAGFRDLATELGYRVRPRNLEETLCTYELPSGPYLVLPVYGPATLRDAAGRIATVVLYFEVMGISVYVPYRVAGFIVQPGIAKEKMDFFNTLSIDPYAAQKALYLAMSELDCARQAALHREFFTR